MVAKKRLTAEDRDRQRRMKWWHKAKFGMFIHWGLYSLVGRHEWAMEMEGFPFTEYEALAKKFKPKPNAARAWAKLAKKAGMKYMVLTTKHHDGFCLFNSKLTDYCAPKQACGRDLVAEYVKAARAEGLRVGFYHSLMDWHHPDGAKCRNNEAARKRFVKYIHGQIRELLTNYGKIDILWYDVSWPLDAKGWESKKMNRMVFDLQPDIIVNDRNQLHGDFSTPEQNIVAAPRGRGWEACQTMNESWGFHKNDDGWRSPKEIVRNLAICARDGGNYLLNIGPKPDGSIPPESVKILTAVGKWMDRFSHTIRGAERIDLFWDPMSFGWGSTFANFTCQNKTLFVHCFFWPGSDWSIGGVLTKIKSATLVGTGKKVKFKQDRFRVHFTGLPAKAPFQPVSVLALKCASFPKQSFDFVRVNRPRASSL